MTTTIVTLLDGGQVRGCVVFLQPKAERATSGTKDERAEVHRVWTDWLDPYAYKAIYSTPTEALAGTFSQYIPITGGRPVTLCRPL